MRQLLPLDSLKNHYDLITQTLGAKYQMVNITN